MGFPPDLGGFIFLKAELCEHREFPISGFLINGPFFRENGRFPRKISGFPDFLFSGSLLTTNLKSAKKWDVGIALGPRLKNYLVKI